MSCKGCGQKSKLIKAHIIPEAFFTGLRDGEKAPRILSNTPGVYPKKSPIGVYDQNILCRVCEDKFQQLDDYGYRVLIGSEDNHEILYQESGEIKGYKFHGVDNNLLKLFFISILWRASISTHSFYSKVELGELEELAQQSIWNMDPLDSHSFSFVLGKFEGDASGRTMLDPHAEEWFGVKYFRFYLYGYILYIKSEQTETPENWAHFIPDNDSLIVVSRGKFEDSKEFLVIKEALVT
jgi:hypothetical protein